MWPSFIHSQYKQGAVESVVRIPFVVSLSNHIPVPASAFDKLRPNVEARVDQHSTSHPYNRAVEWLFQRCHGMRTSAMEERLERRYLADTFSCRLTD